jgi:hypothetical protein
MRSGSNVSRPLDAGGEASVQRTDGGQPARSGEHGGDQEHDAVGWQLGPVDEHRRDQQHHLEHQELHGERQRLAEEDAHGVHPGHSQRVERAVGGLDRERPLHHHEQAEQHGQPHQAGRHPLEDGESASRANANITITSRGERQHLVGDHPAAPLDAQVLGRHQPGDAPGAVDHRRSSPASDLAGHDVVDDVRVARAPARSSSWLATTTVAPAARRLAQVASSSSRPEASRPAWGSSSSQSSARRATRQASAVRRFWPADRWTHGHRESTRQVRAARAPRDLVTTPHGARPRTHVLGDGQIP